MKWVLIVLFYGTANTQTHMQTYEFSTDVSCKMAREFLVRKPYPAMTVDATCIPEATE